MLQQFRCQLRAKSYALAAETGYLIWTGLVKGGLSIQRVKRRSLSFHDQCNRQLAYGTAAAMLKIGY